jgi:hypothetical protein
MNEYCIIGYSLLIPLYFKKCPKRDSNPHAHKDTWPSTMPVYQFQHSGKLIVMFDASIAHLFYLQAQI